MNILKFLRLAVFVLLAAAGLPAAAGAATIDVKAALADRTMGDPKAPVKLIEYASLSCPHCAHFANDTFDQLKKAYIDTGKVFYIYRDIPTNAPALEAAEVSRCLPPEHYFQFTQVLFATQDTWLTEKYEDSLKLNAKLLGMTEDMFKSCTNSNELKMGLIEIAQQADKDFHIDSTPSFVFSNGQILKGAHPLADFQKILDPLVANAATPAAKDTPAK
jgi:protein-disulfide isomerase